MTTRWPWIVFMLAAALFSLVRLIQVGSAGLPVLFNFVGVMFCCTAALMALCNRIQRLQEAAARAAAAKAAQQLGDDLGVAFGGLVRVMLVVQVGPYLTELERVLAELLAEKARLEEASAPAEEIQAVQDGIAATTQACDAIRKLVA